MKFRATMTVEYDVTDQQLHDLYGTYDPVEAAKIDLENLEASPALILTLARRDGCKVEVVPVVSCEMGVPGPV